MNYFLLQYSMFIIFYTTTTSQNSEYHYVKSYIIDFVMYKIVFEKLSYDIVKAHGGELKVETREGEETTFIITL
jgi:hypothetical protein